MDSGSSIQRQQVFTGELQMTKSDQDLRDELAENFHATFGEGAFKAGWDAARANPLRDEKRLWDENEALRKVRDQLREDIHLGG